MAWTCCSPTRPSSNARRTLRHSAEQRTGIGDAHPGDGIEPVALMPDLHVIPGIWTPLTGYHALVRRLEKLAADGKIGAVLPVAYDWRLSNRYNAHRLATIVQPALQRWRDSAPQRADAQLVFVCHSMGGLIARWYIEQCGGADHTRKLVTLGTPYRGAAKAVEQLVNGVRKGIGPLGVNLTAFARSLPSLHQLLPDYACVDHAGGLHRLNEITVPELDTTMRDDALAFHSDLAAAERARPASITMTHAIVGIQQPTWTSLTFTDTGVAPHDTVAPTVSVMVITEFADHPAVAHTVYLSAFWPQRGLSIIDLLGEGPLPSWLVTHDDGTATVTDDLQVARQALCADIDPERAAEELRRLQPQSLSSFGSPSSAPDYKHPTTYIICEQDNAIPVAAQEQMAAVADHVERLPSSHQPMASMPDKLAEVLARVK